MGLHMEVPFSIWISPSIYSIHFRKTLPGSLGFLFPEPRVSPGVAESTCKMDPKWIKRGSKWQNQILDAYEKSAEWRSTLQACSMMSLAGLEQDPVSFCAVMSSCRTSGSWPWMTGIVEHLRKSHQPLDLTCRFPADTAN